MNQPAKLTRLPAQRPVYHYIALAGLLAVAGAYHALVARDIFREIFYPESIYFPPFEVSPTTAIINDTGSGAKAGLRKGDVLLAVDGVPYTGTHVLDEAVANPPADHTLTVTVRSSGAGIASGDRTLRVPLQNLRRAGSDIIFRLIVNVAMPWFCLILGFWVAAVRPRDRLAWLLLGLMLGFPHVLSFPTGAWGPGVRDAARAYHVLAGTFWPIGMLLFGLYFPEPFPGRGKRFLGWMKWFVIAPIALYGLVDAALKTIDVEDYRAVQWLGEHWKPFDTVYIILAFVAIGGFFAAIFAKGSLAVSPDARRRLRLLYFGSCISLTPALVALVLSMIAKKQMVDLLPKWLFFTIILLLLFVFPLTLAYTIVVQRAMDVRVVVRQGLQYAFARGAIGVLRVGLTAGAIAAAVYLLKEHSRLNSPLFYSIIALTILVGLSLQRISNRLRVWTDRRFFRDAYNAEQILSELGDKVRTMVETQPLLAMVSHRIAESLHVPRVAALIDGSGPYRPAYTLGYVEPPNVAFLESAATVRQLVESQEPTRVYQDDPDSWLYRRSDVTDEERRQLEQLGAELLLPLATKDHLLGFISLSQKRSEEPYSGSDLRLLKSVAMQTGLALENSRLAAAVAREVVQREKANRELEIAREVQQRLFPQKLPPVPGLDYAGACRPALGVGGDYYDFLALPDGYLGIALGDVSGKGIAAALMMATLQASLRSEAMRGSRDLGQMISGVNHLVSEASTANRYATFFYAQYEPEGRTLNYVNAGHNPPLLFRRNANGFHVMRLEVGGTVIGLLGSFPFEQASVTLEPGDLLVLYTDGVSEAMNPQDEEWGEARMTETIERCQGLSAAQTLEFVVAGADAFASGAPQHDDMTLVVLRVLAGTAVSGAQAGGAVASL
jgi:phosphoserine phosphatase RsbU/P